MEASSGGNYTCEAKNFRVNSTVITVNVRRKSIYLLAFKIIRANIYNKFQKLQARMLQRKRLNKQHMQCCALKFRTNICKFFYVNKAYRILIMNAQNSATKQFTV